MRFSKTVVWSPFCFRVASGRTGIGPWTGPRTSRIGALLTYGICGLIVCLPFVWFLLLGLLPFTVLYLRNTSIPICSRRAITVFTHFQMLSLQLQQASESILAYVLIAALHLLGIFGDLCEADDNVNYNHPSFSLVPFAAISSLMQSVVSATS